MYVRNPLTMLDPLGLAQHGALRLVDSNNPSRPLWDSGPKYYSHNSGVHWEPKCMQSFDDALRNNPVLPDGRRLSDALADPNVRLRFDPWAQLGPLRLPMHAHHVGGLSRHRSTTSGQGSVGWAVCSGNTGEWIDNPPLVVNG